MRSFGFLNQRCEAGRIVNRNIGQNLAIQVNSRALQPADEFAVRDVRNPAGRVDTDDPQRAEISLLQPPSDISVTERFLYRFLGGPVQLRLC